MTQWVAITGASQGIGKALTEYYLDRGDCVIGLARTEPYIKNPKFRWQYVDLLAPTSIDAAVKKLALSASLDRLILNAGLNCRRVSQWDVGQFLRHFQTNCMGHIQLIAGLASAAKISSDCRIIGIGSFLEKGSGDYPAYALSKAALGAYLRSFAATIKNPVDSGGRGRRVAIIYPGRVNTCSNPKRDVTGVPFREPHEVAQDIGNLVESIDLVNGRTYDLPEYLRDTCRTS